MSGVLSSSPGPSHLSETRGTRSSSHNSARGSSSLSSAGITAALIAAASAQQQASFGGAVGIGSGATGAEPVHWDGIAGVGGIAAGNNGTGTGTSSSDIKSSMLLTPTLTVSSSGHRSQGSIGSNASSSGSSARDL